MKPVKEAIQLQVSTTEKDKEAEGRKNETPEEQAAS